MIKDLRTANLNKDKELKTIFPKSFDFICNTMGYKIEDFNLLLQKKCIQVNSIFLSIHQIDFPNIKPYQSVHPPIFMTLLLFRF